MQDYKITEATIDDIDEIIKLKLNIWQKMDNKDWYIIDGTDNGFIKRQIENNGLVLKKVYVDKIVGFLIVENNLKHENTLFKHLNLQDEFNNCIELCNAAIDYNHRGDNLQTLMI